MPEIRQEVRVFEVHMRCPRCLNSNMRPTNAVLPVNPPLFPHLCDACGAPANLDRRYPRIEYEPVEVTHDEPQDRAKGRSAPANANDHHGGDDAMTDWQAIETAPRGGTKFDAWQHDQRVVDVYWSDIQDAWCIDGQYGPEEPTPLALSPPITHWMQPPSPPTVR